MMKQVVAKIGNGHSIPEKSLVSAWPSRQVPFVRPSAIRNKVWFLAGAVTGDAAPSHFQACNPCFRESFMQ